MNFWKELNKNFLLNPTSHLYTFWLILIVIFVGLLVDHAFSLKKNRVHPYIAKTEKLQQQLAKSLKKEDKKLFIFFIDAFRFDYATDKKKMPYLNSLIKKGVWGKVTPCLANMTVQCVSSAFQGYDSSTLLTFFFLLAISNTFLNTSTIFVNPTVTSIFHIL